VLGQQRQRTRHRHHGDGPSGAEQQRRHVADRRLHVPLDVGRAHRPAQQIGDHKTLSGDRTHRHQRHHPVEMMLQQQRHRTQRHALHRHRGDQRRQPRARQRDQVQTHRQSDQQIHH